MQWIMQTVKDADRDAVEHRLQAAADRCRANPSLKFPEYSGSALANLPFNDSEWFRNDADMRWQFSVPPKGNANVAWVQHFIRDLAPRPNNESRQTLN